MKIFISYSIHNKKIAGELKKYFEEYDDIECFIAHDDIVNGSEWEKEIIDNLYLADYFLPLQTEQLINSFWCQQEAGIAFAKGIKIIPLIPNIDGTDPVGFYKRYQGFQVKVNDLRKSVKIWLIKEGIIESDKSEDIEKRIIVFESSASWEEAGVSARSLLEVERDLTKGDILRIVEIALNNDQIINSYDAQKHLKTLFMKHSSKIPKDQLEEFLKNQ